MAPPAPPAPFGINLVNPNVNLNPAPMTKDPLDPFNLRFNPEARFAQGLYPDEALQAAMYSGATSGLAGLTDIYRSRESGPYGGGIGSIDAKAFETDPTIKSKMIEALLASREAPTWLQPAISNVRGSAAALEALGNQQIPSAAGAYGSQQLAQAMAQQQALAASGQGASAALSARLAQNATADARQKAIMGAAQMAGDEALARRAAQLQAMQGAAGLYGSAGELGQQDVGRRYTLADALAGRLTGAEDTRLRGLQLGEDMTRQWYKDTLGIPMQMLQPAVNLRQARMAADKGSRGLKDQLMGAGISAAGGFIGSLLGKSDKKAKKDIEPGEEDVRDFLDKLNVYRYRYKHPDIDGDGARVSVMAQELKRSKIGKLGVIPTKRGLMVDYVQFAPAMLAAQADLHKRLKVLEAA